MDRQAPRQGAIDGQFDRLGMPGPDECASQGCWRCSSRSWRSCPIVPTLRPEMLSTRWPSRMPAAGLRRLPPDMADYRPPGRRRRQSPGRRSSRGPLPWTCDSGGSSMLQNETLPPLPRSIKSSLSMPSTACRRLLRRGHTLDALRSAVDLVDFHPRRQPLPERRASRDATLSITGRSSGPSRNFRPKTPVIPCSASC